MLNSMTAFSRFEYAADKFSLIWEIRSVNHRYLDAHFRLPENTRFLEVVLKEKLGAVIKRGHIEASLVINLANTPDNEATVNEEKLQVLYKLSQKVSTTFSTTALSVAEILQWPGVIDAQSLDEDDLEAAVLDSLDHALDDLISNRRSEGKRLAAMLEERIEDMQNIVAALRASVPDYELAHQERFIQRLERLEDQELDSLRLNQEIAILISKSDVSEELDRLESHVVEFANILQSGGPVGRRLDFLLQEFNREANTLGSKSIHKDITAASVDLKVLIDQLREQSLNVE